MSKVGRYLAATAAPQPDAPPPSARHEETPRRGRGDPAIARGVLAEVRAFAGARSGGLVAGSFHTLSGADVDPKAWAHALKARHAAGESLDGYQVELYRRALGE